MKVYSLAKINLGLEVIQKREDDYHDILTLFQTIDLYDEMEFLLKEDGEISLQGDEDSIPWDESNLIFQASLLLRAKRNVRKGVQIRVQKKIPPGRGLGGGSSNAAMTLVVLNKIWELGLKKEELSALARELGADVPLFLEGGFCLGRGRGDMVEPLEDPGSFFCVLVFPPFPISTASIYAQCERFLTSENKESKIIKFLKEKNFSSLENTLEEIIFGFYPKLRYIKSLFQSQGAELSLVSGTGSAVFGLFSARDQAEKSLMTLRKFEKACLAEFVPRKQYWKKVFAGE